MRSHDVSSLSACELDRARRELSASLALVRPGSPMRVPLENHIGAIDAERDARKRAQVRVCSCGLATNDDALIDGHLWDSPGHAERDLTRYIA